MLRGSDMTVPVRSACPVSEANADIAAGSRVALIMRKNRAGGHVDKFALLAISLAYRSNQGIAK